MSYYATPPTKWLRTQFLLRLMLQNFLLNKLWLPKALVNWFVRPLPMELLGGEDIPAYVDVLCQTGWWVDRIRSAYHTIEKDMASTSEETAQDNDNIRKGMVTDPLKEPFLETTKG